MRSIFSKVAAGAVMAVAAVAFSVAPVFADGGTPITSADGRYAPTASDRLAVYLKDDSIIVWGIDANLNGMYLTTFSKSELVNGTASHETADGTVTLKLVTPATFETGYTDDTATDTITEVATSAVYTVSWTGGDQGANGAGAFVKTIDATYMP